jgi:hypothetical protein
MPLGRSLAAIAKCYRLLATQLVATLGHTLLEQQATQDLPCGLAA